jgi:hypothetical protein
MMRIQLLMGALLLFGGARLLEGQDLASRIAGSHAARVTFTFEGKPGVCGDGDNFNIGGVHRSDGMGWDCVPGPVRVTLDLNGAVVMRVNTTVGGRAPSGATDLGSIAPAEASDWLLDLAEKGAGRASEEALMPAVAAKDAAVWPRLAAMAKRQDLRRETRKQAIFWLGQEASDHAIGPLADVVDDDPDHEVREMALFALSQQHDEHAFDVLLRTARSNRDQRLRRTAFFWLGQSEDPRGIQFFEEVLAGR